MEPLEVLSPGAFFDKLSIQIAIASFASFYHNVSPKHQKRLNIIVIEESEFIPFTVQQAKSGMISKVLKIIKREDVSEVIDAYNTSNVFLLPSKNNIIKLISEALSFGLPILSYEHRDAKSMLDSSCSMLCKKLNDSKTCSIDHFSGMLEQLYFDPEVRKLLSKGALEKYNKSMNWGLRSRLEAD